MSIRMTMVTNAESDGYRCRKKGLGLTRSGLYDYSAWKRLFQRGFRAHVPNMQDECFEAWVFGWHAADDELEARANGHYSCGRPL